jgi:hypothetical protein
MVTLAVTWVDVKEETELTVVPLPYAGVVTPGMKFVPVTVTLSVCPRLPLAGDIVARVGAGFTTAKAPVSLTVPPPGSGLVTETSLAPVGASRAIVIFAFICVELLTPTEFTVMPGPKATLVTPTRKPVPLNVTAIVCPREPLLGLISLIAGAGFPTMNPLGSVAVPPPGLEFVTVTSRGPVAAPTPIVKSTLICVELSTVVDLTMMPGPKPTVLTPERKFEPCNTTVTSVPRSAAAGSTLVRVGTGLTRVKAFSNIPSPPPGPLLLTVTERNPVAALALTVILTVSCVTPVTLMEFTMTFGPKFIVVTPE